MQYNKNYLLSKDLIEQHIANQALISSETLDPTASTRKIKQTYWYLEISTKAWNTNAAFTLGL